ncbi:MAG: MerR family transcriptional regulator [Armatimonadetes bacterium]|nr:MAG: MerR family transcriptional regulator [Armatimonadota bacterium]
MTNRTIGNVARMSGLTVRTLHHYDDIGLLVPSARGTNGYRIYTESDLERLRTILVYRELGLGLSEIASILDDDVDPATSLLRERLELTDRIERLRGITHMIDKAIVEQRKGATMSAEETLSVFGDFDPADHEEEARERWGGTDAYAQSTRRTSSYTKSDWQNINADASEVNDLFLSLMAEGVSPEDQRASKAVDAHRTHISRWYYDCTPEIHAGLGEMYVQDPRFTANIDKAGDGLAAYMSAAIKARYPA